MKRLISLAVAVMAFVCAARATEVDPLADAVHYFAFDSDLNGDGAFDKGELRDIRYWGSTNVNGGAKKYTVTLNSNNHGAPCWTNTTIVDPSRGITRTGNALAFRLDATNGAGMAKAQRLDISNQAITGDVTVVVRLRVEAFAPEGIDAGGRLAWLVFNGENWASDPATAGGSAFGFNYSFKDGTVSTNAYAGFMTGRASAKAITDSSGNSMALTTNVWYDVAWTLHDNGDTTASYTILVREPSPEKASEGKLQLSRHFMRASGTVSDCFLPTSAPNTGLYLGAESVALNNYAGKGIACDLSRLIMWKRVLSEDEIMRVLMRDSTTFSVGVKDGASGDFGDPSETPAKFTADQDAWHLLAKTITAERPCEVRFTPRTAWQTNTAQVLRFSAAAGEAGDTILGLEVNGRTVNPDQCIAAGKTVSWDIRKGYLKSTENVIRFVRRAGSTADSLAIDAFDLGGAWTVGEKNNSNSEFSREGVNPVPCLFYPGDWRTGGCMRGVVRGDNDSITFRFYVREGYEQYRYRYEMTCAGTGSQQPVELHPIAMYLNGESESRMYKENPIAHQAYGFDIPAYTLTNGWNTVVVKSVPPSGSSIYYWVLFDCHQLILKPRPLGSVILLR